MLKKMRQRKKLIKEDNLPREVLPQLSQPYSEVVSGLEGEGISCTPTIVRVGQLIPVQNNVNVDKMKEFSGKIDGDYNLDPIFVSNDDYILDGHHRAAGLIHKEGKNSKIKTIKLNTDKDNGLRKLNKIQDIYEFKKKQEEEKPKENVKRLKKGELEEYARKVIEQNLEEYDWEGPQPGDSEYHNPGPEKMGKFDPENKDDIRELYILLTVDGIEDIYDVYPKWVVDELKDEGYIEEDQRYYSWNMSDMGRKEVKSPEDLQDFLISTYNRLSYYGGNQSESPYLRGRELDEQTLNEFESLNDFTRQLANYDDLQGLRVYDKEFGTYGFINDDDIEQGHIPSLIFLTKDKNSTKGRYHHINNLEIVDKSIREDEVQETNIEEEKHDNEKSYYIPRSPRYEYDVDYIRTALHHGNGYDFKLENLPYNEHKSKVVTFNATEENSKVIERLLRKYLNTEWVLVKEKDWDYSTPLSENNLEEGPRTHSSMRQQRLKSQGEKKYAKSRLRYDQRLEEDTLSEESVNRYKFLKEKFQVHGYPSEELDLEQQEQFMKEYAQAGLPVAGEIASLEENYKKKDKFEINSTQDLKDYAYSHEISDYQEQGFDHVIAIMQSIYADKFNQQHGGSFVGSVVDTSEGKDTRQHVFNRADLVNQKYVDFYIQFAKDLEKIENPKEYWKIFGTSSSSAEEIS